MRDRAAYRYKEPSAGKVFLRVCPASWSDQEVSELRLVERALQFADLTFEISCGLSDEGDPWCVASRIGSNKVLAHFARIDGTYLGYWEGLRGGTRRGDCLHDLLDRFLRSRSRVLMF
jgi:hypothetical protein